MTLGVRRGSKLLSLPLALPSEWWLSDLSHRFWSVDPQLFFSSIPLTPEEKTKLSLPLDGFAVKVTDIDLEAILNQAHELKKDDILIALNGTDRHPLTQNIETAIKLECEAGKTVSLSVLRTGERLTLPLKTGRLSFRK